MALARITPATIDLYSLLGKIGVKEEYPRVYSVMLHKLNNGKLGGVVVGKVVTHLELEDWCKMNGYALLQIFPGTRVAKQNERTDLF